jgi:indolepyruvate decarboxylase
LTERVRTCGELDRALQAAQEADTGVYIGVVTDDYAAPPLSMRLDCNVKSSSRQG